MGKPADEDMQCRALLNEATKKAVDPDQCPALRIEIPDQQGVWSKYCAGHRKQRQDAMASGRVDENGDRWAPVAIRTTQTKREPWNFDTAKGWKLGDPL